MYAGETLKAFRENNVFKAKTLVRTIKSGKSAQFPAMGKLDAGYHTKGTTLDGQDADFNERVISLDDKLLSDFFVADIDEAMSHYEFRSEMAFQAGAALAKKYDTNLAQVIALAARASATVTGGNGGTVLEDPDYDTDADALIEAISLAGEAMDEKDVPEDRRYCALRPAHYRRIVNSSSKAIHSDYRGDGSIAKGIVRYVHGFEIVKSNNIPSTNVTTGPTAYRGDFQDTVALCWHPSAAGTVELMGLATEQGYLIDRQGWLVVAKYLVGHGILKPDAAVEISKATP
jgi:hypothetical protein